MYSALHPPYILSFPCFSANQIIMSSTATTVEGGGGGGALYFCHKCNHTVTITGDLICPTCNSDFVEELENPNPNPQPEADPIFSLLSSILMSSGSQNPNPRQPPTPFTFGSGDFNPFEFLQAHLANRRASGVNFEFVIEGGNLGNSQLPGNFGDYFIGPGFEELIQHLAENDPNRYGTPPASKRAVEGLPNVKVDEELLSSELAQCAVCKDDFELGLDVKQMPCKHVYHEDCILPWLELHNSCPVCRYELPTDDPDYENRERRDDGGGSSGGVGASGGRFTTVSLPWPLGNFGSSSSSQGGSSN